MSGQSYERKGPLYDPESKVRTFKFGEDYESIRFNILGTGGMYIDTNCQLFLGNDKEWRRPKDICPRPFFIDGTPKRFDALQGIGGDCWLVCAMEALTSNEQLINHVIPPNQDFNQNYIGAFHFRIWQLGIWFDVVVDDLLPVFKDSKTLCYAQSMHGNVFWAALLEKAYAKICGGHSFDYEHIEGGYLTTSFQDLTGGIVERVEVRSPPHDRPVRWLINQVFSQRAIMGCGFYYHVNPKTGLESGHSYTITSVFKCADDDPDYSGLFLVRIMNPWGHKEWKGDWNDFDYNMWRQIDRRIRSKLNFVAEDDGEFWMDVNDFERYFETIWICHLGPGQYIDTRHVPKVATWSTTAFFGEWLKNVSAGGADVKSRHINPHYKILLKLPENDDNQDDMCTVVIELTQRSKLSRDIRPNIGFYLYSLSNLSEQVDSNFFQNNTPLNNDINFIRNEGRVFVQSFQLTEGGYCIVPCTLFHNIETQFLLRVFAESQVAHWEYDTKISKSVAIEEPKEDRFEEELKTLFDDVAKGHGEIDWIGLQEILDRKMNLNVSNLGIFSAAINMFWSTFGKLFSLHQSDDKTGYIVFSKDECRSMIAMLDEDHSGELSFTEFCDLWKKIKYWCQVYDFYKDGKEGYLTTDNLKEALGSIGYNINKRNVHSLLHIYSNKQGHIYLTDFILCGVTLETALTLFQKKEIVVEHKIPLTLEEWVKSTLGL